MQQIEALKKTIVDLVEGRLVYGWHSSNTCNCGVVATTLLNGVRPTDAGFFKSPRIGDGPFSGRGHCFSSELPLPKVFQALKDAGFTHQDLIDLEYLGNSEIVKEMNDPSVRLSVRPDSYNYLWGDGVWGTAYDQKEYLIAYLQAWVRILERSEPSQEKVVYKTVVIDRSVKELQEKELILN